MTATVERLAANGIAFRAVTLAGRPAECIANLANAEKVDEILMGVQHPTPLLSWLRPETVSAIAARTDIPVTIIGRAREPAVASPVVAAIA